MRRADLWMLLVACAGLVALWGPACDDGGDGDGDADVDGDGDTDADSDTDGDGDTDVDGDGDADVDGDGDADGDADMTCGDAEVMDRYDTCVAADAEAPCEEAGGDWGPVGLSEIPMCQCPTSQGECVCDRQTDCLASCVAPMEGMDFECPGVTEGHCSPVSLVVGCLCLFDEQGEVAGYCID